MKYKGRAWTMTVLVTGLVGAFAGVAPAAEPVSVTDKATFDDQGLRVSRITAAAHMTKDYEPTARAFTAPTSMLVDPSDSRTILAATAELRTRRCSLIRSDDAGATWHILEKVPSDAAYPNCTDNGVAGVTQTSIAWGRNSTLYYALEGYGEGEGNNAGHASILLARSTDLGDTWTTTVVDSNRGKTGVAPTDSGVSALTVDSSGAQDVVYVGFSQSYPDAPMDSPLQNGAVVVSTSTDGGATFGAPVDLNSFNTVKQTIAGQEYPLLLEFFFGAPFMTSHNGVVEVVTGSQAPFDVTLPGKGFKTDAMPKLVSRSTDQGRTWTVTTLSPPIFTGTGAQTGMGWTPAGGPQGTFVLAYAATAPDAPNSGTANIVMQRSTDLGQTWSNPLVINDDDPKERFTNFYPQLSVAPNGRVDVVWQDNRGQNNNRFQVRYSYSADGGATWAPNVQVTDQPLNFELGVSFNSDIRQPPGVASANEYAMVGWADTRRADEVTQTQDNYGAIVQFTPLASTKSTALPVVAAVFGGLTTAGVVLLVLLLVQRLQRRARTSGPDAIPA